MAIEDRDYYREDYAGKNGMRYDVNQARYFPKFFRRDRRHAGVVQSGPPDPLGASLHWSVKLLVWLALVGSIFGAFKALEKYRLLQKVVDAQFEQIQSQSKRIAELERALKQKSKVDFFK